MDRGRCPRLSLQRTAPTVAYRPSLRPSPGRTRASTRLPAVVPVQARIPGLADKIHSVQIAFEILAKIGWFGRGLDNKARLDFSTRFRKKRKTQSCPLLPAAFYKELDPTWFRKFLVQFAADLQIWKYQSQRSSDLYFELIVPNMYYLCISMVVSYDNVVDSFFNFNTFSLKYIVFWYTELE